MHIGCEISQGVYIGFQCEKALTQEKRGRKREERMKVKEERRERGKRRQVEEERRERGKRRRRGGRGRRGGGETQRPYTNHLLPLSRR